MRVACLGVRFSPAEVEAMLQPVPVAVTVVVPPEQPLESVVAAVAEADVVLADGRHRIGPELIAAMRRCRLIQLTSAGADSVALDAAAGRGIAVATAAGASSDAVADWTLMAILNLARGGAWADRRMRAGGWERQRPLPRDLSEMVVGVVGLGAVGRAVCRRLLAFGATPIYHHPSARRLPGAVRVGLLELLAKSDVVTLHVALTEATHGLIGEPEIAAMRPGAILVNASRGAVLDELAALDAVRSGRLSGLALDVYATEPLPGDSPLRSEERVFLTPHLAGSTTTTRRRVARLVRSNLRRIAAGAVPRNLATPHKSRVTPLPDDVARR